MGADDTTVAGSVVSDANGPVEYWVQYGPTSSYGSESAHDSVSVKRNTPTEVQGTFGGLARSTLYHYRSAPRTARSRAGPAAAKTAPSRPRASPAVRR